MKFVPTERLRGCRINHAHTSYTESIGSKRGRSLFPTICTFDLHIHRDRVQLREK